MYVVGPRHSVRIRNFSISCCWKESERGRAEGKRNIVFLAIAKITFGEMRVLAKKFNFHFINWTNHRTQKVFVITNWFDGNCHWSNLWKIKFMPIECAANRSVPVIHNRRKWPSTKVGARQINLNANEFYDSFLTQNAYNFPYFLLSTVQIKSSTSNALWYVTWQCLAMCFLYCFVLSFGVYQSNDRF